MGSQHGYQTEAEILFSQYARNIVILQIESLLRERKGDTKCLKILLLVKEGGLREWLILTSSWVPVFCT